MSRLSVSEVARLLNARPRDISRLFYNRRLSDVLAPVRCGRREIPPSYVGVVAQELRRAGLPCIAVTPTVPE